MASPQSTTSDTPAGDKKQEQITFRFCSECSNMLYPKEDPDAHKLQFTCRTCQYTEEAQSTCVFRNFMNTSAGETAGVTQDVGSDPTVSASASSEITHHHQALRDATPVICLGCGFVIVCDTCGEVSSDLVVTRIKKEEEMKSMGLCQFRTPWEFEDPFEEYDEELMEGVDESSERRQTDSEADTDISIISES